MSDYHHAKKMESCPREGCNGTDKASGKFKFTCDDCGMQFP